MTLKSAKIGKVYTIHSIKLDRKVSRRLEALGMTRGTDIQILNHNRIGSVILMVRGSRLALGNKIAENIILEEASR